MTEEELAELRAYKPVEAAQMLNIPISRLETWVREDRVPHQRAGVSRGVEFSADDIRWIGRMRAELMGGRRGGRRAGMQDGQQHGVTPAVPASPAPPAQKLAEWAQLRAHQRTPRHPTR
jgi:hypothetical protein